MGHTAVHNIKVQDTLDSINYDKRELHVYNIYFTTLIIGIP